MEEKTIGLSNSEWNIMESLWESSPQTATQLIKAMGERPDGQRVLRKLS